MKPFNISYTDATVTHSNKYNQNSGIVIYMFFFSHFLQDVVFKLDDTGEEVATTLKNVNLPLHTGQKITLVAVDDNVVAYVDKSSNEFHYITNNLQRELDYGFNFKWIHMIILSVLIYFLLITVLKSNYLYSLVIPLLLISLWIYQRITNFILEKEIDKMITRH